ncbi:ELMO domain-containing protein 2 isoform X1 [Conger conger]|uniref:ELMO domain-containing protein 2 isoform X1 n=1 Tax=Conger conger TaxID=82655 RepID=UPI002A5AB2F7|nr:ELMO domain-containing protein 2 isoform X1 [Conger conger]XP_061101194.1 ELMO domain-containing protein 2 isoform X1 [Conger conger]
MFDYIWQHLFTPFLRFWFKWFLRHFTGKCELQRICGGYRPGAARTLRAEYSLESSKNKVLRAAVSAEEDKVEECAMAIMKEKKVSSQKDPAFKTSLQVCLMQISGYKILYGSVEELRKQPFDCENNSHETMLLRLWDLLMPSTKLESRITKQWGDIGFQGDDPKTDFRGMGMLGLTNLIFFSEKYTDVARQVLSHSGHPKLGYSYAIVGINLTEMVFSLLRSGALKPHFYNTAFQSPKMEHFHQLYFPGLHVFGLWEESRVLGGNPLEYREKLHTQRIQPGRDSNLEPASCVASVLTTVHKAHLIQQLIEISLSF